MEVRIGVSASAGEVAALAADPDQWPPMAGASLCLRIEATPVAHHFEYTIESGLPVVDHHGEVTLTDTGRGGTELVFIESFRPRIWGTGGFLRGRRERALIETARRWDESAGVDPVQQSGPSDSGPAT